MAAAGLDLSTYKHPDWVQTPAEGDYIHGMVTEASARRVLVKLGKVSAVLTPERWVWTGMSSGTFLKVGDLVYVKIVPGSAAGGSSDGELKAALEEDTGVQGSMMAINNANGEVLAMVGGRDYYLSQFNRATQSTRQVGSSFKPYDYVAAFEAGMKPGDMILDAPTTRL